MAHKPAPSPRVRWSYVFAAIAVILAIFITYLYWGEKDVPAYTPFVCYVTFAFALLAFATMQKEYKA